MKKDYQIWTPIKIKINDNAFYPKGYKKERYRFVISEKILG